MTPLVFVRLLVTCVIVACRMEWNAQKVTAEWWVICGMRKVALSAVGCVFTLGAGVVVGVGV